MHIKEKYWIVAAGAIAMGSIALSAFIVLFSPDDPYAPASRRAARSDKTGAAPRPNAVASGGASAGTSVATSTGAVSAARKGPTSRASSPGDLSVNALYAAVGVAVTLTSLFAIFAWEDRRAARRAGRASTQPDALPTQTGGQFGLTSPGKTAPVKERRRTDRRIADAVPWMTADRRRTQRRIVDATDALARLTSAHLGRKLARAERGLGLKRSLVSGNAAHGWRGDRRDRQLPS